MNEIFVIFKVFISYEKEKPVTWSKQINLAIN